MINNVFANLIILYKNKAIEYVLKITEVHLFMSTCFFTFISRTIELISMQLSTISSLGYKTFILWPFLQLRQINQKLKYIFLTSGNFSGKVDRAILLDFECAINPLIILLIK